MKFLSLSPQSSAGNLAYSEGVVSFDYYDRASRSKLKIRISCPAIRPCFFSNIGDWLNECANPYYEKINEYLDVDSSGRYIISETKNFKRALLSGAQIALGLKASDFSHFTSIRMSPINTIPVGCLLSVVIKNLEDIEIVEINEIK